MTTTSSKSTLRWLLPHLCLMATGIPGTTSAKPNIIFILLDGAGWGDFQSHDSLMSTGNISLLQEDGIFLNQSYVLPIGTATRAALLTGRYPHTFGMQDNIVESNTKRWLPEHLTLLPQELQDLNYRTHMVGKWHLGFCHPKLLPLERGFDTFYGFWLGKHLSYYNHTWEEELVYDWWDGKDVDWSAKGVYQTDLLSDRAVRVVDESSSSQPFFLYLAYGAAHGPFEVPQRYIDNHCLHVTNETRRILCGMMAAVDEGVGKLVTALKDKGIYDDTVILFMSDKGGPVKTGAVNWPLRSGKQSVFEGGVRSYTVLKAPGLTQTSITWTGKIHAIDWMPTLLTMAGGRKPSYSHGKNMWWKIKKNLPSARNHFIYNVDDFYKFRHFAIRYENLKLIGPIPGLTSSEKWIPGYNPGWYPPYQLLESGAAVWGGADKHKYDRETYLMYDLNTDPEERTNLADLEEHQVDLTKMKGRFESWVVGTPGKPPKYPLQPLDKGDAIDVPHTDGHLATCWCHPPAFDGGNDCSSK